MRAAHAAGRDRAQLDTLAALPPGATPAPPGKGSAGELGECRVSTIPARVPAQPAPLPGPRCVLQNELQDEQWGAAGAHGRLRHRPQPGAAPVEGASEQLGSLRGAEITPRETAAPLGCFPKPVQGGASGCAQSASTMAEGAENLPNLQRPRGPPPPPHGLSRLTARVSCQRVIIHRINRSERNQAGRPDISGKPFGPSLVDGVTVLTKPGHLTTLCLRVYKQSAMVSSLALPSVTLGAKCSFT